MNISLLAQENEIVLDAFDDYTDLTREQVYVHLNKTAYIKGEMLAFNAYCFIAESKSLSTNTSNLYCQILNSKDEVIKEKLILVNEGISRGDFTIDSLFTSGEYKFKAYTNWMRNFPNEPNYYLESFRVIDPDNIKEDKPIAVSDAIDIQILPESGHLLQNTRNIVGVIAKDQLGLGVSGLKVQVVDDSGNELTECTLNEFGIGQFMLSPEQGRSYSLNYSYNEKSRSIPINKIDNKGIILSIADLNDSVGVSLKTNKESLPLVANKYYKIYIHNGYELRDISLTFGSDTEFFIKIGKSDLFQGTNVFTLFDGEKPIAERMFFNYFGLEYEFFKQANTEIKGDSIYVKVPTKNFDYSKFQNLSISVLPNETKSYYHHQNIISTLHLKPFIKSQIENAGYYFTDVTPKKKFELNNLLLTQGWSSYDWNDIFNNPPDYVFDFEVGISYTINTNDDKPKGLLIYPNINSKAELINLEANQRKLERKGFFPLNDEKLRIGEYRKRSDIGKSTAVIQFSPSSIKSLSTNYNPKSVLLGAQSANTKADFFKFQEAEELSEVKVVARKGFTRFEKLQNATLGRITEFNEKERRTYRTLAQFLSGRGFLVEETPEEDPETGDFTIFRIWTINKASVNATDIPIIFLDGARLLDYDILNGFSMEIVDYVEVNKGGVGEGIRGGAGVIRIYTDPQKRFKVKPRESFSAYELPLTYTTPKRFYVPKYSTFDSDFYRQYGVVDWFPNTKVNKDGSILLCILNTGQPIKLFIEGVVNNNTLISKALTVGN